MGPHNKNYKEFYGRNIKAWRGHNTQHNDIQQQNDTEHNNIQQNNI